MSKISTIMAIIKYELKYYLKGGIFWIITAALLIFIYSEIFPYIMYFPIETERDLANLKDVGAFTDFLIDKSESDIKKDLKNFLKGILKIENISSDEKRMVEDILPEIDNKDIAEIEKYFQNSLYINYIKTIITAKRDATLEEAKDIVDKGLDHKPYSFYFARRYADRISVFINFIVLFVFAFIFSRDKKDNINEITYSKPIKGFEYVCGKYLGALIPILILLTIITVALDITLYYKFTNLELEFDAMDIFKYSYIWTLVSVLYSSALITVLSLILRNGIAVIPVYMVYFIIMIKQVATAYTIEYPVDFFHFIIRSSEAFFDPGDVSKMNLIAYNRYLYTLLFILLLIIAILLWSNSRTFSRRGEKRNNVFKRLFKPDQI